LGITGKPAHFYNNFTPSGLGTMGKIDYF